MKAYLRLLRPKQWSKNLLVFAAILFTNGFSDTTLVAKTLMAFAAMCLFSSGAYVFNDIRDVEKDRAHPVKKNRPIAASLIQPRTAIAIGALLLVTGAVLLLLVNYEAIAVVAIYALLQMLYNCGGKGVPVLDVFLISSGFVLRAVLGAAAISKPISVWLLLCTGALALLLGFAKRRHEYILQGDNRASSRASLAGYSKSSLDALVIMCSTAAALCYGIYALESTTANRHPALVITTPFVFYGICRYVLIVFVRDEGGEPENVLFSDRHILASVILFVLAAIVAMTVKDIPLIELTGTGGLK